jgi:hypothetical protein
MPSRLEPWVLADASGGIPDGSVEGCEGELVSEDGDLIHVLQTERKEVPESFHDACQKFVRGCFGEILA